MKPIVSAHDGMNSQSIAYFSNMFPAASEPYVMDEVKELRSRGCKVAPFSARRPGMNSIDINSRIWLAQTVYIQRLRLSFLIRAIVLCFRKSSTLAEIIHRILFEGTEGPRRRAKALLHTLLGAYLAILIERSDIDHIHVHHGYFSCWIAMVAARLRGITYSVTLHGSDLLLHGAYLDIKLKHCQFVTTVSEFNKRLIHQHFPEIRSDKIHVRRLGTDASTACSNNPPRDPLIMLAVGRLHEVKNHSFLIRASALLKQRHIPFACLIAGEGKERRSLELHIEALDLQHNVVLLGQLSRIRLDHFYSSCNLVVLTSRSEGIPQVLMEAMARGKMVLAPSITGVPELVVDGQTGFLFEPGSMESFLDKLQIIRSSSEEELDKIRGSARQLVARKYDRETNQAAFLDLLLHPGEAEEEINLHENSVLQQI